MNLTEKETKALRKLQKYERQFRKMRYFFLSLCILMIGLGVYTGNLLADIPEKFEGNIELQALLYSTAIPQFYFFCGMTGFIIGITIKNWIGDPNRTLLIGLAERLERDSDPVDADNPFNPPENPKNQPDD